MTPRAALFLVCILGACADPPQRVGIRGSDSEVNLVQRLAEVFMAERPEIFVSVTGGGSGVGIASLLDGTCDLASSSRPLEPVEKLLALRADVDPVAHVFARDAVTVIVHEANPIATLRPSALSALFSGEHDTWEAVGGEDRKVIVYGRQSSSGTYVWFRDEVVKRNYAPTARQMSGSSQIVEAVARDPGGIGYVAVGYLQKGARGVKAVSVEVDGTVASPLDPNAARNYPIVRPLYQFSRGKPEGAVKAFLAFEASPKGRAVIEAMGFFSPTGGGPSGGRTGPEVDPP